MMDLENVAVGANASMFRNLEFSKIKNVYHPQNIEELRKAIHLARKMKIPITPKGGGTGLSGACTGGNIERVVITTRAMNNVLDIDKKSGTATTQPGITPRQLNAILIPQGMRFYVTPSSDDAATLGGMVSTDAGGADAWLNGTMYDNTVQVKMIDYLGHTITITKDHVEASDSRLEAKLNELEFTLRDVAQSHGVLGFISEVKVKIRPVRKTESETGIIHFKDYDEFGQGLCKLIETKTPLFYGETIVEVHPQFSKLVSPPLIIVEYPKKSKSVIQSIGKLKRIKKDEYLRMRKLRAELPKKNPDQGLQKAYFEGYGFDEQNLARFGDLMDKIDSIWINDGYDPFLRYGHGPCKWYSNDQPVYGLIMHAREVAGSQTSQETFNTLRKIIKLCEQENIIPKPEHKWPYMVSSKKKRLQVLCKTLGSQFNPFILTYSLDDLKPLVL